jgi:hypothetical protein
MRWVWPLVIACLVAASVVRPVRGERRDPHAAQLDAASATRLVIARRQASQLPEPRLAPYVVARAPVVAACMMVTMGGESQRVRSTAACAVDNVCARGPPLA